MPLGRLLQPAVSLRFKYPGCRVSWALSLGAIASVTFRLWQLPLPLLFFTPFASLVFLENFGFVGVDGGFGSGF